MRRFLSFNDFDWVLLAMVLALSVISVLEIYSATLHTKFVGFDRNQVLWLLGGMAAMFVISLVNYHRLLDIAVWAYGIGLVSLVAVIAVGTKTLGARRWIKLPGGIHFQPSEWVKLILILAVARYFANLAGRELTWGDVFKGMAMVGVPMLLVLKQPDLGTALTYSPILLMGLFLGLAYLTKSFAFLIALLAIAVMVVFQAWLQRVLPQRCACGRPQRLPAEGYAQPLLQVSQNRSRARSGADEGSDRSLREAGGCDGAELRACGA